MLKIQREFEHTKVTVSCYVLRLASGNVSIEQTGLYHFHEFRCFLLDLGTTTPTRACVAPDNGEFGVGSGFGLLVDDGPGMKRPQYSRTSLRAGRGNPIPWESCYGRPGNVGYRRALDLSKVRWCGEILAQ